MSYYYISNPYNGSTEERETRAQIAARVCGILLKNGIHAWSPIVHNHAMMKVYNEFSLDQRRSLILDFDFSLLKKAKAMIVLMIPGWEKSFGVQEEIKVCNTQSIPIVYLNPDFLFNSEYCT
jgi:hypothetical protein